MEAPLSSHTPPPALSLLLPAGGARGDGDGGDGAAGGSGGQSQAAGPALAPASPPPRRRVRLPGPPPRIPLPIFSPPPMGPRALPSPLLSFLVDEPRGSRRQGGWVPRLAPPLDLLTPPPPLVSSSPSPLVSLLMDAPRSSRRQGLGRPRVRRPSAAPPGGAASLLRESGDGQRGSSLEYTRPEIQNEPEGEASALGPQAGPSNLNLENRIDAGGPVPYRRVESAQPGPMRPAEIPVLADFKKKYFQIPRSS
ncbi:uncharacterized protein LOC141498676 [Macrotis lagotis]|uniref:uncharacterized protein LOC141498676 n=1 Tax=Macrotis lagotis TaxID=92651 RepID=UPI003D683357